MKVTAPTERAYVPVSEGSPGIPLEELVNSGLLWLINSTTFWPRGYSLALVDRRPRDAVTEADARQVTGFDILGDGTSPYLPSSEEVAQRRFDAVQAFLAATPTHVEAVRR